MKCATINPAKVLKLDENYGSLSMGKYANIVILNGQLEPFYVIYKGKTVK